MKFRKEFRYPTPRYVVTPVYVRKSKKHKFLEIFFFFKIIFKVIRLKSWYTVCLFRMPKYIQSKIIFQKLYFSTRRYGMLSNTEGLWYVRKRNIYFIYFNQTFSIKSLFIFNTQCYWSNWTIMIQFEQYLHEQVRRIFEN